MPREALVANARASYVHRLLDHLGHREHVPFVAHDVGVAYALAAQQAAGRFLMDHALVGRGRRLPRSLRCVAALAALQLASPGIGSLGAGA